MRTKLFLMLLLVGFVVSVNAQSKNEKPFKIGAGALIGLPIGDMSNWATMAWGLDLMGEYAVAPSIGLTLSAGYVDWIKKSGESGNWSSIPILVGGKYYFPKKFYCSGQVGVAIYNDSSSGNVFSYALGVGYKLSEKFDLLLKYQSAGKDGWNDSFFGIRAGYTF